jgi:hypothetical protein
LYEGTDLPVEDARASHLIQSKSTGMEFVFQLTDSRGFVAAREECIVFVDSTVIQTEVHGSKVSRVARDRAVQSLRKEVG